MTTKAVSEPTLIHRCPKRDPVVCDDVILLIGAPGCTFGPVQAQHMQVFVQLPSH